jgi:hypothetical protein
VKYTHRGNWVILIKNEWGKIKAGGTRADIDLKKSISILHYFNRDRKATENVLDQILFLY